MLVTHTVIWRDCAACGSPFGTSTEHGMRGMKNKRCETCRASGRQACKPASGWAPASSPALSQLVDEIIADLNAAPTAVRADMPTPPPAPARRRGSVRRAAPPPASSPATEGRRCSRCHTLYPPHLVETAFRLDASRRKNWSGLKWTCRPCEQTARDERKQLDRWAVKARDVVRRHVLSLQKSHPGITKTDLIEVYGWEPDRLAHDAEFQYGNGCNYCGEQYKTMGHGLADITLDVQDPKAAPYYRTNTKWCCMTCNRLKGSMSPEQFERNRQVYRLWSAQRGQQFDPLVDDPNSLFHPAGD